MKIKRQVTNQEKTFVKHISNESLPSKIYKECLRLNNGNMLPF